MTHFKYPALASLFCLFSALFSVALFAAEDGKYKLDKLNELLNNLDTFKADFNQKIYSENGNVVDEVTGEIAIKKPGKFYWNVTEPFEQKLIADGKYLWQYDVDLEQATVRNLNEALGSTPAEILSGRVADIEKQYQISFSEKLGIESFRLIPKEEGQFEYIILEFRQGVLIELVLKDTLAQTTKVIFKNAQFGLALPDTLFLMELPKGIDIVDSRTQSDFSDEFSGKVQDGEQDSSVKKRSSDDAETKK